MSKIEKKVWAKYQIESCQDLIIELKEQIEEIRKTIAHRQAEILIWKDELEELEKKHFCQLIPYVTTQLILTCWEDNNVLKVNMNDDERNRCGWTIATYCPICGKKAGE